MVDDVLHKEIEGRQMTPGREELLDEECSLLVLTETHDVPQEAVDYKVDGADGEVGDAGLGHESAVRVLDDSKKQRFVLQE